MLLGVACLFWMNQPLSLSSDPVDLAIEPGTSPRTVAHLVADAGVQIHPTLLYWVFRLSGRAREIKAGSYEVGQGTTPYSLLRKLVRGDETLRAITLVEGWNFRQLRDALAKAEAIKPDTQGLTDSAIMDKLGHPGLPAEGRFFPDTYNYAKGASDLAVLKRDRKSVG